MDSARPPEAPALPCSPSGLTRRQLVALLALAGAGGPPAQGRTQFGSMLWAFVHEYLRILDERRAQRLAGLESREAFQELRERVRTEVLAMWGGFPESTPVEPRHVGTLVTEGHAVERIVFESRPSFHVTANLYRPRERPQPVPAVVLPCGHSRGGKTDPSHQRFAILLARHGIAVLVWDPVGQGERLQLLDSSRLDSQFGEGSPEHRVLGDRCYLVGDSLMQFRAWDTRRALDYLESRPDIDAGRLAIAGHSGGGMTALQYAGLDDRLQAAFVSCAVASFRAKSEALLLADPEQVLFGTLRAGIDHPELLAAHAPRPLMIGAARHDYVPLEGTRRTHRELETVYRKLGAAANLQLVETDAEHGLNRELREAAARFFLRHLAGRETEVREEETELPAEGDLLCTGGQVLTSLDSRSVSDLLAERADSLAPRFEAPRDPSGFEVYRSEIVQRIRDVTRVGAYKAEFGIDVPTRFLDAGVYARGTVFLVAEQGKDHPVVRRYCIDPIVAADHSLVGVDVRGWGATAPAMPGTDADFPWEDFLAYRCLELGRPLFGQRLKDLLATAPTMTRRREWILAGIGLGGLLAAHAAALDERVAGVVSIGAPLSYRSILDDPRATQPLATLLPGVLGRYEVRDVYAAVAPRPLLVVNPQDPRRRAVSPGTALEDLAWTAGAYGLLEAPGALRVESGLGWSDIRSLLGEWLGSLSS